MLRLSATTFSQSVSAMHRNNDIFSNYHSKIGIGVRCATYRRPVVARFEMASHLLKTRLLILLCLSTITHNKFYTSIPRSQKECMFSSATVQIEAPRSNILQILDALQGCIQHLQPRTLSKKELIKLRSSCNDFDSRFDIRTSSFH